VPTRLTFSHVRKPSYIDDRTLRQARDPEMFYLSEFPRMGANGVVRGVLDEGEIVLTTQLPQGIMLILDIVNGRALFLINPSWHGLDSALWHRHCPSNSPC